MARQENPATPTVFIVDDDEAVRDSFRVLLESHGLTVKDYGSTAEFARDYRPQAEACLILDQHLPGSTGLDFLASPEGARLGLAVILVTGRGEPALESRALALGVRTYLEKPFSGTLLLEAIARSTGVRPK
jgi:FixJ family two-component response regulator